MKKTLALIILFSITLAVKSQNNEIENCIQRFQYHKGLELCKAKFPNSTDSKALLLYGHLYNKLNLPDSALLFLNKIPVGNQDYLYLSEKIISFSLLKNQSETESYCDQLFLASFKTSESPIILKAIETFIMPKINRAQSANDLFEKIKETEYSNPKYHLLMATYLLNTSKIGEAATEFERAIFYDSLNPTPYYMLGKIYSQNKSFPLSIESFNKSIAKDSSFYPSYKELGNIYYDLGKNQKALETFKFYCDNNVISQNDSLKLASMYLLCKQYADAETINNTIIATNPTNIFSLRLKAYLNLETDKNIPEAINAIEKMFSLMDTIQIITSDYEYRGRLYSKSKKDSIAIVNFNMALSKDSSRINNYEYIAKSLENLKMNVAAASQYEKLINRKEKPMPSDFFFMGRNYYIAASRPIDSLIKAFPEKLIADSLERIQYLIKADTAFGSTISLSSSSHLGYLWKARVQGMLDPETILGLALPFYLKTLSIIEAKPEKYKKEMIESYKYIGYYYFMQFDNFKKSNNKEKSDEMKSESLKYWQKVIALDPEDKTAMEAIKKMNK